MRRGERIIGRYTGSTADANGRKVIFFRGGERRTETFSSPQAAAEFVRAFEEEVAGRPQTLAAALDLYCVHKRPEWADTCEKQRRYEIASFFGDLDVPFSAVTPATMGARYEVLVTQPRPRTNRPVSAATHGLWLRLARYFLRWCASQGWLASNPLDAIRPRGTANAGKPQLRRDELRRLLEVLNREAAEGDEGALGLLLIFWCALSPAELLRRQVRDLDDGGRILWVDSSRVKDGVLVPSRLKTRNRRRQLVVPSHLIPWLGHILQRAPEAALIQGGNAQWLWGRLKTCCRRAKVPRIATYSLRGMQATLRAARGSAIDEIARDLGNTPQIARQHYVEPGASAAHDLAEVERQVAVTGIVTNRPT